MVQESRNEARRSARWRAAAGPLRTLRALGLMFALGAGLTGAAFHKAPSA